MVMPEKRFGYLDFIKGISIIWVVFCHRTIIPYDSVAGNIMMMLAFSSVPCFMMCSGYVLLFKQERAKRSLQRAWHVYTCMVVWKALYFLYFQLFDAFPFTPVGLIRYLFLFSPMEGIETEHFWFLQAYLPALLITPLLSPMFYQRRYGMVAAFVGLFYLSNQFLMSADLLLDLASSRLHVDLGNLNTLSNIFPMGGEYSSMTVCFLLGGVHRLMEEKGFPKKPWFLLASLVCLLGGLGGMLLVRYLQTGSFEWHGKLLTAKYEWTSTLVMSFGMFSLLRSIGDLHPAKWIGRHLGRSSMGIYYLHYLFLMPLAVYVFPHAEPALWMNIVKAILVAVVCVPLVKLGKRIPLVRELFR